MIFSGLLDALVCALRELQNVILDSLPRMADAALWATAGESAFGWERGAVLMGSLVSGHNRRTDRQIRVVDVALDIRAVFCSGGDFPGPGAPRVRSFWSRETTRRVRRVHDGNPIGRNVGREPCVHVGRTHHGCSDPFSLGWVGWDVLVWLTEHLSGGNLGGLRPDCVSSEVAGGIVVIVTAIGLAISYAVRHRNPAAPPSSQT